ncbi:MAG TPA: SGNH/GDSL hydrolase family protein [Polyangiaceae bacterium]|nr:SGNH/GDSL hydrolase family protein [Polyangiaceae bacterium]
MTTGVLRSCVVLALASACACSSSGGADQQPAQGGSNDSLAGNAGSPAAGASAAGANAAGANAAGGSAGESVATGGAGSGGTPIAGAGTSGTTADQAGDGGKSGSAGSGGAVNMTPAIHWIGRVAPTASGARFSWPGTGFSARFNGTGAKATLKTGNADYLQLVVDGQVSLLSTQSGSHVYTLASGLASGEHTVTVWRRTEPNYGTVEAGPITFDGTLLAPASAKHRIEVIGDSITVGFGVECKTNSEAFSYATENNYLTYEALTARKFSADVFTEAWSGMGLWRDVGGGFDQQMPVRYVRTIPNEDTTSTWDFAGYVPDALLINLGTNDFAKGDPGQPFVDAYQTLVADLRKHYPMARLYLSVSPMLSGDNRTKQKGYLTTVQSARTTAGDHNVAILEFMPPASDAWTCGHPNAATHVIMATAFEQALSADLGW